MATSVTTEGNEQQVEGKSASTRLLDLIAGWAAFVAADEDNHVLDSDLSSEEIADLYQTAGALVEEWEALSVQGTEEAVHAFVEERIVPLLLRKGPAA